MLQYSKRDLLAGKEMEEKKDSGVLRRLFIDAAGPQLLIALMQGERILAQQVCSSAQAAGEILSFLSTSGWLESVLPDQVVLGGGPGSYTGLRVALASAGSLSFAWRVPIVQVSSLAAYARPQGLSIGCLDARAGGVYGQLFEDGIAQSPAQRLSDQQLLSQEPVFGMAPSRARLIAWCGPHREELFKRLGSIYNWQQHSPQVGGLYKQASLEGACVYRAPFHGLRPNYLKEDEKVAHRS